MNIILIVTVIPKYLNLCPIFEGFVTYIYIDLVLHFCDEN